MMMEITRDVGKPEAALGIGNVAPRLEGGSACLLNLRPDSSMNLRDFIRSDVRAEIEAEQYRAFDTFDPWIESLRLLQQTRGLVRPTEPVAERSIVQSCAGMVRIQLERSNEARFCLVELALS